jgi:lipopolysaccharide/colanic/teichoic acid biosynthesis glycosyltransferase
MDRYAGKRAFDLTMAGSACVLFGPVMVALTVATIVEDGGPALFIQRRVGSGRKPFEVFKFRSMRNGEVTRVGRWVRRTGLDELPQFLNVCRGEMSVVGPRPLTSEDVQRLGLGEPGFDWRFVPKPGITGLSQLLSGQGARASRRLDRLYLRRQGPLLDLQLVALSFAVNIIGKRNVRRLMRMGLRCAD